MILYIEKNPNNFTKRLLEVINEFSKVGYKIITQKSIVFLYTNNELSEREIRNNLIYSCNNKKKVPRNKFNQGGKRPVENFKILKKETEEDTNKWKHISCL